MNKPISRISFSAVVALCLAAAASAQSFPPYNEPHYGSPGWDDPKENPIGVTDGTPISTTTIVATDVANSNAFINPDAVPTDLTGEAPGTTAPAAAEQPQLSTIGIDGGMGSYSIDGTKADYWTLTVPYDVKVNARSTIETTLPLSVTNYKDVFRTGTLGIGDAKVYGEGVNAGWCYKVFDKQDNVPYRWKLTPSAGVYLRSSSSLDMGSWVYNVGISSSFAFPISAGWIANIGNSITMAWNSGYSNYPDPMRDQQQVAINGLQVFKSFGRWLIGGMVIDTRYFKTNLINSYQTYAITAGFKLTPSRSLRVSLVADSGKGYHSITGKVGSSWKF